MAVSMKASAIQPMEAQFKLEILKNIKVPSRKSQKELDKQVQKRTLNEFM